MGKIEENVGPLVMQRCLDAGGRAWADEHCEVELGQSKYFLWKNGWKVYMDSHLIGDVWRVEWPEVVAGDGYELCIREYAIDYSVHTAGATWSHWRVMPYPPHASGCEFKYRRKIVTDPGEGYRLLDPDKDEKRLGDGYREKSNQDGDWGILEYNSYSFVSTFDYRREIDHTNLGDKEKPTGRQEPTILEKAIQETIEDMIGKHDLTLADVIGVLELVKHDRLP